MASFGSVQYNKADGWVIRCEPFVKTRLKRVFPRVPQHAADRICLSATPENTRELQWFLQRYPMELEDQAHQALMTRLAYEHVDTENRLADLLAGHIAPERIELAEPPRDYQMYAAAMLDVRRRYLLADSVGLGKTVSAICCLVKPGRLPAVVVTESHLVRQWARMIKRFAPALQVHALKKGTPYDLTPRRRANQPDMFAESSLPDVILTSYHMLRGWAETLAGVAKLTIFDECQRLRSPATGIHHAAALVSHRAQFSLGLSATPIYNYGDEFHHVLNAIAPDSLGDFGEFLREHCTALGNGKHKLKDAEGFGGYLRREGLMLIRSRIDVGRELPPLERVVHEIDADEKALEQIKGNAVELAKIVLRHNEQFRGERMQAAGQFESIMRQATGISKAPFVIEFVKLLLESGEPVVLFGWHRNVYDLWLEGLREYSPVLYTGSESQTQKDEAVQAILQGKSKVLILSLRSGAGLDGLQGHVRIGIFGELDWSPGVLEQCVGRFHRDGADGPCTAYFLLSSSGSDPIMAEVLGLKREQIDAVRSPGEPLAERIDTGEGNIKRLARELLLRRGIAIPEDVVPDTIGSPAPALQPA